MNNEDFNHALWMLRNVPLTEPARLQRELDEALDKLGQLNMTAMADRKRANEAARLSAAARDEVDDLRKQLADKDEHVSIVEEGRSDLIVDLHRMEDERDKLRAEVERWKAADGTFLGLAFDYVKAEPGTDAVEQAWYQLKGAVEHWEAVEKRRGGTI